MKSIKRNNTITTLVLSTCLLVSGYCLAETNVTQKDTITFKGLVTVDIAALETSDLMKAVDQGILSESNKKHEKQWLRHQLQAAVAQYYIINHVAVVNKSGLIYPLIKQNKVQDITKEIIENTEQSIRVESSILSGEYGLITQEMQAVFRYCMDEKESLTNEEKSSCSDVLTSGVRIMKEKE